MSMRDLVQDGLHAALAAWVQARDTKVPKGATLDEIACIAFNLRHRLLPVRKWQVRCSPEIAKHLDGPHGVAIRAIQDKASRGATLREHQSDKLTRARFHDRLLNDWGINHLHLGLKPDPKKPGFLERTPALLFVASYRDQLLLLDVRDHGSFEDVDLLEIVHRRFPEAIARMRMGIVGLEREITPQDRRNLRRNGVLCPVTLSDGTVYIAPGGGYSGSGLSVHARLAADHLLQTFADVDRLNVVLTASGGRLPVVCSAVRFDLDDQLNVRAVKFLPPMRSWSVPVGFVLDHVPTKRSA